MTRKVDEMGDGNRAEPKWEWWAGYAEDRYDEAHDTREAAIEWVELNCDAGGWITEALAAGELRLANYFNAEDLAERAEDLCYHMFDPDGDPTFNWNKAQGEDLEGRVRAAIDAWQEAHGLTFKAWAFQGMRNTEYIEPARLPASGKQE